MSTATTAASSSIPSFYTMDGTTRLNGTEFASGLDTQNLIKALTAKTAAKIDKQKQLQQKAQWKQTMFHSVEDLLQKLSDTYLSYSTNSPTNLMSRSFFDSEQLVSSASSIVTATGSASDAKNVVINSITNLASAAVYTGSAVSVPDIHSTEALGNTVSGSSYLNLSIDGNTYAISLGKLTYGSGVDITKNEDGTVSSSSVQTIADGLNNVLKSIKPDGLTSLYDKVSFSSDNGVFKMTSTDTSATITGASQNFIDGFGMTANLDGQGKIDSYTLGTSAVRDSIASLSTQLSGTTLTVQLDGVSKTISFNQSESSQFGSADSLATFLQGKLNDAYGSGKITVTNDSGKLNFKTADGTSVMSFPSSSDSGVLGTEGLLHIRSGESNRLETDKTLDELVSDGELQRSLVSGTPGADGLHTYSLTVNGKEFTFEGNTELNTVINTINNDQTAGVTISYSQTLNQFRITSDDTGKQGMVNIYDNANGGNLAAALFGGNTEINSGKVDTTSAGTSNYSVSLNGGAAVSLSVTNTASESLADLEKSVQESVDATSLSGKVTVEISSDGTSLTFRSVDGTPLTIASAGTPDILGLGAGKTTNKVAAGQDCKINATVGGTTMDIERETNTFTLDGVSLDILGQTTSPTSPITFSASDNTDDLYKKISDFVDSYNKIIDLVNTDVTQMPTSTGQTNGGGTAYEPLTDDQKKTMTDAQITDWNTKAQQGLLFSDPQLSALQTDIRKAMEGPVDSVGMSLANVGISTGAYDYTSGGKLQISTDKLKAAIKDHPEQLEQLFTNSDGIATRLNNVVSKNIGAYGNAGTLVDVAGSSTLIGTDTSELAQEIKGYSDNIKDFQDQLKTEQETLQAKFTTMETIISKLSSQFSTISNMGAGGGS